ncbi:unnamed protein product [Closterium sp. NIES-53]
MEDVVLPSIRVGHSGGGAFESLASDPVEKKKLTLGVCVMEKKVGRRGREGRWEAEVRDVIPLPSYLSRQPLPPFPFHHPPSATPLPPSPFPPPFAVAIVSHGPPLAPLPPFLPPPLPPPHSATPLLSPLFRHPFCSRSSLMAAILDRLGPLVDLPLPAPTISPLLSANPSPPSPLQSRSSPMTAILDRLRMFGEVEVRSGGGDSICSFPICSFPIMLPCVWHQVIIFEDHMILHDPIEKWPICDALIAFYSTGFPLAKAQQYAALRKPYLVNELEPQWLLHDRRKVYAKLEEHGLMMPTYAIVNREGEGEAAEEEFEEEEDYVVIAGKRINKPFVEKPVDGGCMDSGGGCMGGGGGCVDGSGFMRSAFKIKSSRTREAASSSAPKPFIPCSPIPDPPHPLPSSHPIPCPPCVLALPGDDHSVMIYYPSSAGGGMKELFRKVGNRSSEFHPDVRHVRRHGSYIYEEFLPTGGTDVKVYTVGPDYAHAEARKSPVVDGVVMRSADGKEVRSRGRLVGVLYIRYPVLLTPTEKEMARVICLAFGQAVCGFDLLRSHGRSFVCDVNGWSFVKNSSKYYDDAACVLRSMLLRAVAPHLYSPLPVRLPWSTGLDAAAAAAAASAVSDGTTSPDYERTLSASSFNSAHTFGTREELRCVIAVIRHGDRTPKQKVKLVVTQERLLKLMLKYNGGKPRSEAKLKSAVQLQDLLDALRALVPHQRCELLWWLGVRKVGVAPEEGCCP